MDSEGNKLKEKSGRHASDRNKVPLKSKKDISMSVVLENFKRDSCIPCWMNNAQTMAIYLICMYEWAMNLSLEVCFIDYDDILDSLLKDNLHNAMKNHSEPVVWKEMAKMLNMLSSNRNDPNKEDYANHLIKHICRMMKSCCVMKGFKYSEQQQRQKSLLFTKEEEEYAMHKSPYVLEGRPFMRFRRKTVELKTGEVHNGRGQDKSDCEEDDGGDSSKSSSDGNRRKLTTRTVLELVRKNKSIEDTVGYYNPEDEHQDMKNSPSQGYYDMEIIELPLHVTGPVAVGLVEDLMDFIFTFSMEPVASLMSPRSPIGLANIIRLYFALHIERDMKEYMNQAIPPDGPNFTLTNMLKERINRYMEPHFMKQKKNNIGNGHDAYDEYGKTGYYYDDDDDDASDTTTLYGNDHGHCEVEGEDSNISPDTKMPYMPFPRWFPGAVCAICMRAMAPDVILRLFLNSFDTE